MRLSSLFRALNLLTLPVLLLTACSGAAPAATPRSPGTPGAVAPATAGPLPATRRGEVTLKVGLHAFNQATDPVKGGFEPMWTGIAETLFKLSSTLAPGPWLATGARQLDEKTWEIAVRPGVKFHNGAPLDAHAVKGSLERAVAKSPTAKTLLDLARVDVSGPSTLTIVTNGPSPILPALLSDPTTAIVDAAAAERMGDGFGDGAVLTGPFKVERFQLSKELVVVRHRDYWGPPPLVDRIVFTYIPDNNSRALALQSGDIDISTFVSPESVGPLQKVANLKTVSVAPLSLNFMYLNHKKENLKDVRVRQAIAGAIDREALVKAIMQSQGIVAAGPLPPTMLRCDDLHGNAFDAATSRQLLAQVGYQDKDGDGYVEKEGSALTLTLLTYRQRPELPPMAEAIQAYLKSVGIKVNIRLVEQINAALAQDDWDAAMYSNNMATTGDPYASLSRFFTTGGSANRGAYRSSRVDALTRELGQATGRQMRLQLACGASQAIVDTAAIVALVYPNIIYGLSAKVIGLDQPSPIQFYLIDGTVGLRDTR